MMQCKHWRVTFQPPVGKKEAADATAARQQALRDALKKAEVEWNRSQAAPVEAVKDWFYHRAEHNLLK